MSNYGQLHFDDAYYESMYKKLGLCQKHNKMSLRHMLEIEGCDGFCQEADPCDEILQAVKNCKNCLDAANPSDTYPYFYDGGVWILACSDDDNEIDYAVVEKYATSLDNE